MIRRQMLVEARPAVSASSHAGWVRLAHWIVTASVLTLGVTGVLILMVHPRLYWGDAGNDLTPALIELPISRNYQHGGWTAAAPPCSRRTTTGSTPSTCSTPFTRRRSSPTA
jgi:hypothetical protein